MASANLVIKQHIAFFGDDDIIFNTISEYLPGFLRRSITNEPNLGTRCIINQAGDSARLETMPNYILMRLNKQEIEALNHRLSRFDVLLIASESITDNNDILETLSFRSKLIINLTSLSLLFAPINVAPPFSFYSLLTLLERNLASDHIFCLINDKWIYNESASFIASRDVSIALTDKENSIIRNLLLSPGYSLHRDELQQKIWNYNSLAASHTVATHLYKLKQKLPDDMLLINNAECSLNIANIC